MLDRGAAASLRDWLSQRIGELDRAMSMAANTREGTNQQ
jgi:hypothetical protein